MLAISIGLSINAFADNCCVENCCCSEMEGYYLSTYSCGCVGGNPQDQECHYIPLP